MTYKTLIMLDSKIRYVSYYDAEDFCLWRSSLEGMKYRLPEHYEWQKAAAWDPAEQHFYSYGYHRDVADCGWSNFDGCGISTTTEVGYYSNNDESQDAKSYYGCYDMSGNVQEWVCPDKICGGGFGSSGTTVKTTYNYIPGNDYKSSTAGFRCVMVP